VFVAEGLKHILAKKPDIICLQEANKKTVKILADAGYDTHVVDDALTSNPNKGQFVATFTKLKITDRSKYEYSSYYSKSLLTKGYKLFRRDEKHEAAVTEVEIAGNKLVIFNLRLSTATGPEFRIKALEKIICDFSNRLENIIVCGDLNVIEWRLFKTVTGWTREYKQEEYAINERNEVDKLFASVNLTNIFSGRNTIFFDPGVLKGPHLQLDHVVVGKSWKILNTNVTKKSFGSDHKILFAELEL